MTPRAYPLKSAIEAASSDLDHAVTGKLLRLGHGCLDAVDEVKRRFGAAARCTCDVSTPPIPGSHARD